MNAAERRRLVSLPFFFFEIKASLVAHEPFFSPALALTLFFLLTLGKDIAEGRKTVLKAIEYYKTALNITVQLRDVAGKGRFVFRCIPLLLGGDLL